MIWILQQPAWLVGSLTVLITVVLSVVGLFLFRRVAPSQRLQDAATVSEQVFTLSGVLYAVLVAFVVVVVWEQFDLAQTATESEATAISDLLRDSAGLPAPARALVQKSLISYTKDVVDAEFPQMNRGEELEQQSAELREIWQSYAQVEPVTQSEIAFYRESVTRLDDLGTARKNRITGTNSEIPSELWILLLGGGVVMLIFTYLFATPDFLLHASLIALAAALLGFVLYLIFALEHPFVGSLSVPPEPYVHVLGAWPQPAPR
jgi:Protein of unknown function (DUF4239)